MFRAVCERRLRTSHRCRRATRYIGTRLAPAGTVVCSRGPGRLPAVRDFAIESSADRRSVRCRWSREEPESAREPPRAAAPGRCAAVPCRRVPVPVRGGRQSVRRWATANRPGERGRSGPDDEDLALVALQVPGAAVGSARRSPSRTLRTPRAPTPRTRGRRPTPAASARNGRQHWVTAGRRPVYRGTSRRCGRSRRSTPTATQPPVTTASPRKMIVRTG
jgi:hypothetical protein